MLGQALEGGAGGDYGVCCGVSSFRLQGGAQLIVGCDGCRLAIVLYFVIPRSPTIAISNTNTLTSSDANPTTTSNPAEFSFEANVALQGAFFDSS